MQGRTYTQRLPVESESTTPSNGIVPNLSPGARYEEKHYVDTGVGYSVTDGVLITAKRRD